MFFYVSWLWDIIDKRGICIRLYPHIIKIPSRNQTWQWIIPMFRWFSGYKPPFGSGIFPASQAWFPEGKYWDRGYKTKPPKYTIGYLMVFDHCIPHFFVDGEKSGLLMFVFFPTRVNELTFPWYPTLYPFTLQ